LQLLLRLALHVLAMAVRGKHRRTAVVYLLAHKPL